MLYSWKIEDLLSNVLWSIQWHVTTLQQFRSFCVTQSSVDVCYIHRIWPHRVWLVILSIPRQVRSHSKWILLFQGTFSHSLVFPSVQVVLNVMLMDWWSWYIITGWRTVVSFLYLNKHVVSLNLYYYSFSHMTVVFFP